MPDVPPLNTFSNSPPNTNVIDADPINANFTALRNAVNALDADNMAATGANLTDAHFAATAGMYSAYKTVQTASAIAADAYSAGTYFLAPGETGTDGLLLSGATTNHQTPDVFYFDDADYAISGRTTKLRVRAQVLVNATAPAITFTFGLYPVTVGGGPAVVAFTAGTVVSGSTTAIASPGASAGSQANSGDFTIPSDGYHALCVALSGDPAANFRGLVSAQLQVRHT
jgi:hypothetical protein